MEFGLNFFPCLHSVQRSPEQYFSDVLHLTRPCDGGVARAKSTALGHQRRDSEHAKLRVR
jgi:hypothetical protein